MKIIYINYPRCILRSFRRQVRYTMDSWQDGSDYLRHSSTIDRHTLYGTGDYIWAADAIRRPIQVILSWLLTTAHENVKRKLHHMYGWKNEHIVCEPTWSYSSKQIEQVLPLLPLSRSRVGVVWANAQKTFNAHMNLTVWSKWSRSLFSRQPVESICRWRNRFLSSLTELNIGDIKINMCANGIWPNQQENKIKDETKQNAAAAVRKTHRESRTSLLSYAIVGSFCTASATSLKLSLAFDNHGGGE